MYRGSLGPSCWEIILYRSNGIVAIYNQTNNTILNTKQGPSARDWATYEVVALIFYINFQKNKGDKCRPFGFQTYLSLGGGLYCFAISSKNFCRSSFRASDTGSDFISSCSSSRFFYSFFYSFLIFYVFSRLAGFLKTTS